jgi:hypothetical protein
MSHTRRWASLTVRLLAFLLAASFAEGQSGQPEVQVAPLKADDIMARVAANQDRSEAARTEYTYKQHIHISTHHSERVMREEKADYEVVLLPDGTAQKQLKLLTGRYWNKDKYVEFQGEAVSYAGSTNPDPVHNLRNHENLPEASRTDEGLIRNLRNHLSNDKSHDGLARDLFPLTSEEQKGYEFTLVGQEVEAGRNVYHIAFTPKDKEEPTWAGEAFICHSSCGTLQAWITIRPRRLSIDVEMQMGSPTRLQGPVQALPSWVAT